LGSLINRSEWSLRFARPRVRWLTLMAGRAIVMVGVVIAILICWDRDIPWPIVAFLMVVLAILFGEAFACDRRRTHKAPVPPEDADLPVRRRRETDL